MKQRISSEQLRSLSPGQQARLREDWKPKDGDYIAVGDHEEMIYYVNGITKKSSLPLLTVGELVGLLTAYDPHIRILHTDTHWVVSSESYESVSLELVDALWNAAKDVLWTGEETDNRDHEDEGRQSRSNPL